MSSYVVWIDHEKAKLFKMLAPGHIEGKKLEKKEILHHNHNDKEKHKNSDKFFHDVATELKDASELLLIGPGLGKEHFKHHLEKHHHERLAKFVVGMISVDHPSENEILAQARKFFKKYDAFQ